MPRGTVGQARGFDDAAYVSVTLTGSAAAGLGQADAVNSSVRSDPSSPLYGVPVLGVD